MGISLVRSFTEKLRPPRALFCDFPLGRPLGRPGDAAFQHEVLAAAFALLEAESGPVIRDFPVPIHEETEELLACVLPPPASRHEHPAVAEAEGLLPAYRRSLERRGRTNVGRHASSAEEIPALVAAFVAISQGQALSDVRLPATALMTAASDIRAFYEEAALALMDHVPLAQQVDRWIYTETQTGRVLVKAWSQLERSALPPALWRAIVPALYHTGDVLAYMSGPKPP